MLRAEGHGGLSPLAGSVRLVAKLMEHGGIVEGQRQTKGVCQLLSQDERLLASCQGLVRIAKMPQGMGHMGQGEHANVNAATGGMGAVLLWRVVGNTLRMVFAVLIRYHFDYESAQI